MAFRDKLTDLYGLIILVALTLPSIATNIDCNGKPFHCLNTTHFMICVDLGSGISSTIDDFVIPCPPTTVCKGTNHFECEFPAVTIATTDASTYQDLAASVRVKTYEVTTSIPFEEYYDTVSTTTSFENLLTQQTIETEPVTINEVTENTNVITLRSEWNSTVSETNQTVAEAQYDSVTHAPAKDGLGDITTNSALDKSEKTTVSESRSNSSLENIISSTIPVLQNNPDPVITSSTTVLPATTLSIIDALQNEAILSLEKNTSSTIDDLQNNPDPIITSSTTELPTITLDTGNNKILTVKKNSSSPIGALQNDPDPITISSAAVPAISLDTGNDTILPVERNTLSTIDALQNDLISITTLSPTVLPAITLETGNEANLTVRKNTSSTISVLQNDSDPIIPSRATVLPVITLGTGNETILPVENVTSNPIGALQNKSISITTSSQTVLPAITLETGNETNLTLLNEPDPIITSRATVLPTITLETGNEASLPAEKNTSSTIDAIQNNPDLIIVSSSTVLPTISLDETILPVENVTPNPIDALQNNSISMTTSSQTVLPAITLETGNETNLTLLNDRDPIITLRATVLPAITLESDKETNLTLGKNTSINALQNDPETIITSKATVLPAITFGTGNEAILFLEKNTSSTIDDLQNNPDPIITSSTTELPTITLDTGNKTILTVKKISSSTIGALQNDPDPIIISSATVLPAISLDTGNDTILPVEKNNSSTIHAPQYDLISITTSSPTVLPAITLETSNQTNFTVEKETSSFSALQNDPDPIITSRATVLPAITSRTGNKAILPVENVTSNPIGAIQNNSISITTLSQTVLPAISLETGNKTNLDVEKNDSSLSTIAALQNDSDPTNTSSTTVSTIFTSGHDTTLYSQSNTILSDKVADIVTEAIEPEVITDVIKNNSSTVSEDLIRSTDPTLEYNSTQHSYNNTFSNADANLTDFNDTLKLAIIELSVSKTFSDDVPTIPVNVILRDSIISDKNKANISSVTKVMMAKSNTTFLNKTNINQTNTTLTFDTKSDPDITAVVNQHKSELIMAQPEEKILESKLGTGAIIGITLNPISTLPIHKVHYATYSNFTDTTSDAIETNYIATTNDASLNAHTIGETSNADADSLGVSGIDIIETTPNPILQRTVHDYDTQDSLGTSLSAGKENMTHYVSSTDYASLSTNNTESNLNLNIFPAKTAIVMENKTKSVIAPSIETPSESYQEPVTKSLSETATQRSSNNVIDIIEITRNPTLQGTLHGTHNNFVTKLNISQENKTSNVDTTDYALLNGQKINQTLYKNSKPGVTTFVTDNNTEAVMALSGIKQEIYQESPIVSVIETINIPATLAIFNINSDLDNTAIVTENTAEPIMDPSESYQKHQVTTPGKPAVFNKVDQHNKINERVDTTRTFDNKLLLPTTNTIDITEIVPITIEKGYNIPAKQTKSAQTNNDTTNRPLTSELASKDVSTSRVSVTESAYSSPILNPSTTTTFRDPTMEDILNVVKGTENDKTKSDIEMYTGKNAVQITNKSSGSNNSNIPIIPILNSVSNYTKRATLVNPITEVFATTNERPQINVKSAISKFELTQPTNRSLFLDNLHKGTQPTPDLLENITTTRPKLNVSSTVKPNISITSVHQQISDTFSNKPLLNVESGRSDTKLITRPLPNVISNIKTSSPPMDEFKLSPDLNKDILNLANSTMNATLIHETSVQQTNTFEKPSHTVDIARSNLLSMKNIQNNLPDSPAAINSSFYKPKADSNAIVSSDVTKTNGAVSEMWRPIVATDPTLKSSINKDVKPLVILNKTSQPSELNIQTFNLRNSDDVPSTLDAEIIDVRKKVISQKTAPITTSFSSSSQLDTDRIMLKPIQASTHLSTTVITKPTEKTVFKNEQLEKDDDEKPETENEEFFVEKSQAIDSNIAGLNKVTLPTNTVSSNLNPRLKKKETAADITLPYTNQIRLNINIELTTKKMEEMSETQSTTNIEQISTATSSRLDQISSQSVKTQADIGNNNTRSSNVDKGTRRYVPQTKSPLANTHNIVAASKPGKVNLTNYICESNVRGRFSDSKDCRKFYICIGRPEPIKGICPNNTVFSELWKQCTKNLSHCVRNQQFQCMSEGRFSDYLKDNIYYICVKNNKERFIRFRLQCQSGYHLNKTAIRCELNTELNQSTSQQSTSDQSVSSAKSEKLVQKSSAFECKEEGKFPDPNECRRYYVCYKKGKSQYRQKRKQCDSDEIFHKDKKKCVDADSYDCN